MSQKLGSPRNEVAPFRSFKYRTGAAALKCLADGQVYFASPWQLNDTLEAKFDFSGASDAWEAVKATINELAVTRPTERVDPSMPVPQDFVAVHEAENKKFYEACQRVGVCSTASRPDNQPMWAYYCDNSAGMCLELEWSADVIAKENLQAINVTYMEQSRRFNRIDDMCALLRELATQNPRWSINQLMAFSMTDGFRRRVGMRGMARAASMKHADWQHEAEVRILAPHAGPRPILNAVLKKLYFVRTDFPEWGPTMTLLHRLYPDVGLAHISFHHTEPFTQVNEMELRLVPLPHS